MPKEISFTFPENSRVKIILKKGDITNEDTDAIVNAANSYLQHGGGVAAAIVRKGGYVIQEESNKIGFVKTGECAVTNAGKLKAKKVIHTVGPVWGSGNEDSKLFNATVNPLREAEKYNLQSISFPAVSSGIFGFPKDRCAKVMLSAVKYFVEKNPDTKLNEIRFCIIDNLTFNIFKKEFEKYINNE